jgi:hypothetical protein
MIGNPIAAMLSWDALYNWAQTQPIAGDTNSSFSCPIARFLDSETHSKWTVDEGQATHLCGSLESEGETYSLPQWAAIVADAVDAVERDRITREQFLAIMDEVRPEVEE